MGPVILVAGSLHHDLLVEAPTLPRLDQTVTGTGVRYLFGGKGGNQAIAAARAGARVHMAGAVGRDASATVLRKALLAAGVDATQVRSVPGASGMSVALQMPDGSYGAVIVSGANLAFRPQAVRLPKDCAALVLQSELPEAANLFLARRAGSARVKVILNAAPARPVPAELLRLCDLLVVNRGEAADLCGLSETGLDPLAAAEALRAMGPQAVIVTLGADGLVLDDGTAPLHLPARRVAVVSTHGAGDAFVGALVAERARGATLVSAAAFGQAAAALHVASPVDQRDRIDEAAIRGSLAVRCQPGTTG